jgi:hypothetical protein
MGRMSELADLYPGFESRFVDTSVGRIFTRVGGAGPPLLLLHGYPQTNVMYHQVAPALAERFTLVLPDLPGYGWSVAPRAQADHSPYTKRAWRSTIPDVSKPWPCSTSCRPTRCGTAWTASWRCGSGTGPFSPSLIRCPRR